MREFRQLQQYATTLSELMNEAATLDNQAAEATDGTGVVRVVLDTDGLPENIWVESEWRRDLEADAVGAAVVEAAQAAANRRMEAWAEALEDSDVTSRLDDLNDTMPVGGDVPQNPFGLPVGAGDRPRPADVASPVTPHPHPRPVEDLAEDMIAELDRVMESADPSPRPTETFTGVDSTGGVTVVLNRTGLMACHVDEAWASDQTGAALTASLAEALQSARAQLSSAPAQGGQMGYLDQLLSEAFGILSDPKRLAGQ